MTVVMQAVRLLAVIAVIMVTLPIASVFGAGYQVATPIIGTTGAAALASPSLFSGVMTVIYADGAPVLLSSNQVNFYICSTSCVSVAAKLKQTAPGAYSYTFTPPSLSGTVTIYVKAGSLADDNGRIFPSVDTQVGAYASPSTSSSSSVPAAQSLPGSPMSPESTQLTRQAAPESPAKQQAPVIQVALALVVLSLVAVGLLIVPTRRK